KSGGVSGELDYELNFARIVSISAYREYHYRTLVVPGFSFVPVVDLDVGQAGHQVSEELQLVSPNNGAFNWVLGLYYFDALDNLPRFDTNIPSAPPGALTRINTAGEVDTSSYAAFGQATAKIFPATNLTLGFRHTYEKRTYAGLDTGFIGP